MESPSEKTINGHKHIAYQDQYFSEDEMLNKSEAFHQLLDKRRSVRDFSDKPVAK